LSVSSDSFGPPQRSSVSVDIRSPASVTHRIDGTSSHPFGNCASENSVGVQHTCVTSPLRSTLAKSACIDALDETTAHDLAAAAANASLGYMSNVVLDARHTRAVLSMDSTLVLDAQ
jgi:hypothetical protein